MRTVRQKGKFVPSQAAAAAQVPFMITNVQKQQLREMGHTEEAIQEMTPATAHKLLGILPPLPY